ncbi:MAG: hypothetical protein JST00_26335 [Deltaproteobacteria bacterium]|nr:hypothetical protein [Deltaproteobacteria bacterium]
MRVSSLLSRSTTALSVLALVSAAACGGAAEMPSTGSPPSLGTPIDPPSTSPAGPGTGPTTPSKPPIPAQPTGPYSGLVGTTDVSILYPLPSSGEVTSLVRPSAIGNHGALFSESLFDSVLGSGGHLERTSSAFPSGYSALAVIGVRLDPCGVRKQPGCASEVRLVLQAIANDSSASPPGPVALDGGVHVIYEVPADELVTMQQEILFLKSNNGDVATHELGVHPILKAQGLGGAFAEGLRNILLFHLGDARVAKVTFFDHNMDRESDGWLFANFVRSGATMVQENIPLTTSSHDLLAGTSAVAKPISSSRVFESSREIPDDVTAMVASGTTAEPARVAAFEAALRVENPLRHTAETTTCVNCHLAQGATALGDLMMLDRSSAFTHARSLARVDQRTSVTNLHAFGYLGRQISVMQRTANESVRVAEAMHAAVLKTQK